MDFQKIQKSRIQVLNDAEISNGRYVLYWMQIARRLERNHALDYALRCAQELGKPLVVYEGLRQKGSMIIVPSSAVETMGLAIPIDSNTVRGVPSQSDGKATT